MQLNRRIVPVIATLLGLFVSLNALRAQEVVPGLIDYQGYITNVDGDPLGGPIGVNYSVEFRIYDEEEGPIDDAIWAEAQTFTVRDGLFSVRLGEGIEIGNLPRPDLRTLFAAGVKRFLGVTVIDGQPSEISPRLAFLATPYSMVAQRAAIADSLNQTEGTTITNALQVNGAVTAGSVVSEGNVEVQGNVQIQGRKYLEFGAGVPGKQGDAGKIGYGVFRDDGDYLEIVGAGSTGSDRKVHIYAEGGASIQGPLTVTGLIKAGGYDMSGSTLNFGTTTRQMLNLWGTEYAMGVQSSTLYSRSGNNFAWHIGGTHNDGVVNPGGGLQIATLTRNDFIVGLPNTNFGLTVRGTQGVKIQSGGSLIPGANWRLYEQPVTLFGAPLWYEMRLQHSTSGLYHYWTSIGNSGISSDIALKKDVVNLEPTLTRVLKLRPVDFRYISSPDNTPKITGFIAQDVEKLFPDLVVGEEGSKGLADTGLIPITVMALQEEHQQRIGADASLAEEIGSLRDENATLLKRLETLEALIMSK